MVDDKCCRVYDYKYYYGDYQDYCFDDMHQLTRAFNMAEVAHIGSIRCGNLVDAQACERGTTVYDRKTNKFIDQCDLSDGHGANDVTVNQFGF